MVRELTEVPVEHLDRLEHVDDQPVAQDRGGVLQAALDRCCGHLF
jgi:hypothetical protein